MEVCAPCKSACPDISSSTGSAIDPLLSMNDLKICLTEFVVVEEGEKLATDCDLSTRKNEIDNRVREYECLDEITLNNSASDKCLSKCTTFPLPGFKSSKDILLNDEGNHEEDATAEVSQLNGSIKPSNKYSRSISLPIPSKLVSAMKGSREKHGIPPKKLSVSWAPGVYDPIPTSVSHVPSSKNQRHISYGKKAVKHKHKGRNKYSQGSSRGKEKKQGRKTSKSSGKYLPFHEVSGVDSFGQPHISGVDWMLGARISSVGAVF